MLDDLNGAPITGDSTKHVMRLAVARGEDRNAGAGEPPAQHDDERFARHFKEFGERIRRIRRNRGWSIRELSNRSGIGLTAVSGIEAGKNTTLEVLWRLANALRVHWADLLNDPTSDPPATPHTSAPFEQQLTTFATRIYQVRALQRLSQQALANHTGLNRNTIECIETGTQNIRLDTLLRLAAGLGVHWADLLDDRQAAPPRPEPRLHEALEQASQLRTQLEQLRMQLTLAQARAEVAERVAEQTAAKRIGSAAEQTQLIFDRYDRPRLAALRTSQLTGHLDARRTLYDYLDRIWRDGQRQHLDQRPEWAGVAALRNLAQHLTATALDEQLHRN